MNYALRDIYNCYSIANHSFNAKSACDSIGRKLNGVINGMRV